MGFRQGIQDTLFLLAMKAKNEFPGNAAQTFGRIKG